MSRAIKFRVWDKREKRMISAEETEKSKGNLLAIGFHGLPIAVDSDSFKEDEITGWNIDHYLELMQFTGLFDKNGKEIYEGDIVRAVKDADYRGNDTPFFGTVEYRKAGYYIVQPHDNYKPSLTHLGIISIEIIGNIYENQDLLEKQQGR